MNDDSAQPRAADDAVDGDIDSTNAPAGVRLLRKWSVISLGCVGVLLFPWSAYLSYTLPSRHLVPHWDAAWAGFDLLMASSVILTLVMLLRRSAYLAISASISATFLLCDAWFDMVTSRPGTELVQSGLFALFGEIPLAALLLWLARDADKVCAREHLLPRRADR